MTRARAEPTLVRARKRAAAMLDALAEGQHWRVKKSAAMRKRHLAGMVVRVDCVCRTNDPLCAVVYASTLEPRADFGPPLAPHPPATSGITIPIAALGERVAVDR